VVRKTEKDIHDYEFHTEKKCEMCEEILGEKHLCKYRIEKCIYCFEEMEWVDLETHEPTCGSQTVNCVLCNDIVIRKKMKTHIAIKHNINPLLRTNLQEIEDIIKNSIYSITEEKKEIQPVSAPHPTPVFTPQPAPVNSEEDLRLAIERSLTEFDDSDQTNLELALIESMNNY
jgi:hypothetical protein